MRNVIFFCIAFALFVSCQPTQQGEESAAPEKTPMATESVDPTVAAADHYKVEIDNDRVRVLRVNYAAGDETPMHSHPDGVAVFLEDGNVEMTFADGTKQERPGKAGGVLWAPAETHSPKAVTAVSVILVELKEGSGGEATMAEPSATDVAPDHYKVELDNDRVRVLRINYAAGDETAMHSHPDGVVIFLEDGNVEMTLADGTKREQPAKAGDVVWAPAETHSPKAVTANSVILVELKGSGS